MSEDKMIICKSCGSTVAKNTKTCPVCGAKIKKPFFKKWWFWAIIAVIVIGVLESMGNDNNNDNNNNVNNNNTVTEHQDTTKDYNDKATGKTEETKEDNVPGEYRNALKKAKSYSDLMNMSKQAIYDQLTSEYGEISRQMRQNTQSIILTLILKPMHWLKQRITAIQCVCQNRQSMISWYPNMVRSLRPKKRSMLSIILMPILRPTHLKKQKFTVKQ